MKAIFKYKSSFGRSGTLSGVFVAEKEHIKALIDNKIVVYFGEILGKHSEVYCPIDKSEITEVTSNPEFIKMFTEHDLETGINPLDYSTLDSELGKNKFLKNLKGVYFDTVGEMIEHVLNKKD